MSISSKNFVTININSSTIASINGSRNVAVLIDCSSDQNFEVGTDLYLSNLKEYLAAGGHDTDIAYTYANVYFSNGGQKLHFIKINQSTDTNADEINAAAIIDVISNLPNEEIVIATTASNVVAELVSIYLNIESNGFTGIDEKIIISYLHSLTVSAKPCVANVAFPQPTAETFVENKYYTRSAHGETTTGGYLKDSTYNYQLAQNYTPAQPAVAAVAGTPLANGATGSAGVDYYTRASSSAGIGHLNDGTYAYSFAGTGTDVTADAANKYYPLTNIGADAQPAPTYYILLYVGNDAYVDTVTSASEFEGLNNFELKYGPRGIEMTIAAYLSNINVYRSTIADYCYTDENVTMLKATLNDGVSATGVLSTPIVSDDALFKSLVEKHINMVAEISSMGAVEYPGDKTNGQDIVNEFVRIVLTQTCTARLLAALKNKLRYNQVGLSVISSVLVQELQAYKAFGYLTTSKTWTDGDWYDASGEYLIIEQDTPIAQGYFFKILPFSSLNPDELAAHMLPEIYLIIATSYGIRTIKIIGQVF